MNRYNSIPILKNFAGKRHYAGVKYHEIPYSDTDFYVIAQEGDRYDLYANMYYKDSSLWWIIASANPKFPLSTIYPEVGRQIRIPLNITDILRNYELLNR